MIHGITVDFNPITLFEEVGLFIKEEESPFW